MPVFSGNVTGSVLQVAANIPSGVMSFSLVNKSAGTNTVNMYVRDSLGNNISIIPYNLLLDSGDTVFSDSPIKILAGASIFLTVTASLDYYVSIE
jgi:hypothetical protein